MLPRLGRIVNSTLYRFDTSMQFRNILSTPSSLQLASRLPPASSTRSFGSLRTSVPSPIGSYSQNIKFLLSFHFNSNPFQQVVKRRMGGGPRNEEHKIRLRAIRKARKIYFKSLPPRPPKPPVCTKHYDEMCKWKTEPISKKIEHRVVHICSFIIYAWLNAYPKGASLRKMQRDIAFRMQRRHRLPGKLPIQVIMPIVGKLERENYLKTKMKSNGHVLIYRDKEENIVPENQYDMRAEALKDDEAHANGAAMLPNEYEENWDFEEEWKAEPKLPEGAKEPSEENAAEVPIMHDAANEEEQRPTPIDIPYDELTYRPKFTKEQKPKERKVKKRKIKDRSDPVMEKIDLPEGTRYSPRGPRYVTPKSAND